MHGTALAFLRALLVCACLAPAAPARSQSFGHFDLRCAPIMFEDRMRAAEACGTPGIAEAKARADRMMEARRAGIERTRGPDAVRAWRERLRRGFPPVRPDRLTPENCAAAAPHLQSIARFLNSAGGEELERQVEKDARTSDDPIAESCN